VAIDGISLTVNEVEDDYFTINVIPHTSSLTTLAAKGQGQTFNLEVDILGRYIKRLLEARSSGTDSRDQKKPRGLTIEELIAQGF
jgi:riboflavin synthase